MTTLYNPLVNGFHPDPSVVRVGDTMIGSGRPGPVAAHLYRLFLSNMGHWLSA